MSRDTRSRRHPSAGGRPPTPRGVGAYVPTAAGTPARGSAPVGGAGAGAATPSHDFRPPRQIPVERQRLVAALYERLTRALEGWLTARVRADVRLVMTGVEPVDVGELVASLSTPCAAFTFRDGASGRAGLVDVGHEVAFFLVERLFGGSGDTDAPDRALTPIERMALRTIVERALGLLAESWREHAALDLAPSGFESIPELLRLGGRREAMLVARLEVAAEHAKGHLVVALPAAAVEGFLTGIPPRASAPERAAERERAERALRAVRVGVAARFPIVRAAMRELAGLREGDVLATGLPTSCELLLLVGGRPRFRAAAGRVGQRLACRLLTPLPTSPNALDGAPPSAAEEQPE